MGKMDQGVQRSAGGSSMTVYNVDIQCRCGRRAQIVMPQSPHLMRPRPVFKCRRCGNKNPHFDVSAKYTGSMGMGE